jgi:hypothetical protein
VTVFQAEAVYPAGNDWAALRPGPGATAAQTAQGDNLVVSRSKGTLQNSGYPFNQFAAVTLVCPDQLQPGKQEINLVSTCSAPSRSWIPAEFRNGSDMGDETHLFELSGEVEKDRVFVGVDGARPIPIAGIAADMLIKEFGKWALKFWLGHFEDELRGLIRTNRADSTNEKGNFF